MLHESKDHPRSKCAHTPELTWGEREAKQQSESIIADGKIDIGISPWLSRLKYTPFNFS